jgi:DNA-binding NtrC family response regulator
VPNSILIVEHLPAGARGDPTSVPQEWGQSLRTSWESFAPEQLRKGANRLLIANAVAGTGRAEAFFRWLRGNPVPVPVFAILPAQNAALLEAAAETVDDFLLWPACQEEFRRRVARLLGPQPSESKRVQASLAAEIGLRQLVGDDPEFQKVLGWVALYAPSDAPVLVTGETGTGKELCARVVHLLSKRQEAPFIPVDCGALPDHLFENEVFGHVRGAYTDARSDQKGLVALAQRGTLFLDEIDSLSASAQSKVLRLLQERSYRPLGSERFSEADVRIIAATNRELDRAVAEKHFRADLFFRINVLRIHLPALRDRPGDIPLLSRHFLDEICRSDGVPKKVLSQAAAQKLERYGWPGNVRELYNTLQRAVVCSPGTQISASAVDLDASLAPAGPPPDNFRNAKLRAIETFEREYVRQILEKNGGNVTRAAREAGKDRRALGRLAQKYGVRAANG